MYKTLAAHQPNFFPTLSFFDKMKQVDLFVIRDETLFSQSQFHHRNKIRVNSDDNERNPLSHWIGVKVENSNDYLKNVRIVDGNRGKRHWKEELLHQIKTHYQKAPYFDQFFPGLEKIIAESPSSLSLVDFNMKIIDYIAKSSSIQTPIILASTLGLKPEHYQKSDPSEDLVEICKKLGADSYLSGAGGKNYLNLSPFENANIHVSFQEFEHPTYPQKYLGFLPNMSAIDALFCLGLLPLYTNELQQTATA